MEGMMMGGAMPRGADPAQLPEPQSAGARLVNQYCTQCHGMPTPALQCYRLAVSGRTHECAYAMDDAK